MFYKVAIQVKEGKVGTNKDDSPVQEAPAGMERLKWTEPYRKSL